MKAAACRALRRTLAADRPAFGLWVTLDSPAVTEAAVALGLDWVVVDAEHGHLDWEEIAEHVRATVRSETAPCAAGCSTSQRTACRTAW